MFLMSEAPLYREKHWYYQHGHRSCVRARDPREVRARGSGFRVWGLMNRLRKKSWSKGRQERCLPAHHPRILKGSPKVNLP